VNAFEKRKERRNAWEKIKIKRPKGAKYPVCIIFSTCIMSFITVRVKMINPKRKIVAPSLFRTEEIMST
jgi:hypothetical protein